MGYIVISRSATTGEETAHETSLHIKTTPGAAVLELIDPADVVDVLRVWWSLERHYKTESVRHEAAGELIDWCAQRCRDDDRRVDVASELRDLNLYAFAHHVFGAEALRAIITEADHEYADHAAIDRQWRADQRVEFAR